MQKLLKSILTGSEIVILRTGLKSKGLASILIALAVAYLIIKCGFWLA